MKLKQTINNKTIPPPEARADLSDLQRVLNFPRAVWVLIVGSFINRLGTFVLPYLALYLSHLEFGAKHISAVMAAWGAGNLVATVVGGHLADTLGRRITLVLSMISCAILLTFFSFLDAFWAIFAFAFLTAAFAEIYRPAGHALVADFVAKEDRVLAYACIRWAINAGFAIGPAIAGLLAKVNYQWIFWFDAATSAIYGIIAWKLLPKVENYDKPPPSYVFKALSSLKESFRVSFSDRKFVQVFFANLLIAFAFLQTFLSFGFDVKERGFSEFVFGLVLGLNGLMIVLFELPLSMWIRHKNQKRMMVVGYVLIGLGFSVFYFQNGLFPLFAGMAILTVGEMIALPVGLAYVSNLAPDHMRGRYMGMWGFSWAISMAVASTIGITLLDELGRNFWLLIFGLCVLAAGIMSFKK